MEFGRVEETALAHINFSLPKEPLFNAEILSGKKTMPIFTLVVQNGDVKNGLAKYILQKQKKQIFCNTM